MFKVMLECNIHCEDWENVRETLRTNDPVAAIRESEMLRDQDHISWVEEVKPEKETGPMMYSMSASRGSSGIEAYSPSMKDAMARLEDYARSFPGELVEVHITKII
jgi:hypothetical protein